MKKTNYLVLIIIGLFILGGGIWFILASGDDPLANNNQSTQTSTQQSETTQTDAASANELQQSDSQTTGAYVDYSPEKFASTSGKKVFFFHAKWCPTCKALDQNIRAGVVPDGLTIFKVDYDTEDALKKDYAVTYQHTLVQVDDNYNQLHKWSGSYTINQITDELI